MKNYKAYEYKDLVKDIQKKVFEEYLQEEINFQLSVIWQDVEKERITEFVPSVYYQNHKEEMNNNVEESLKIALFTKYGKSI
jgi:hypothetical protein